MPEKIATATLIVEQYNDNTMEVRTEFSPEYKRGLVAHDLVATIYSDLAVHFTKTNEEKEQENA